MPSESTRSGQSLSLGQIKKSTTAAGVFIQEKFINLALTGQRKNGSNKELVQWSQIPIPDQLNPASKRFPSFLRATIQDFLGSFKKVPVWTAIETKDLKFRHLVIPDLPESKIPNAALWSLKKEFEIDEDSEIFDFQVLNPVTQGGIQKRNLLAFTGQKEAVRSLEKLFKKAGFPLTGITAMPFALQNCLITETFVQEESPFIIINISQDHSDIFCFAGPHVKLVRNIRTGAASLLEEAGETAFVSPDQPGPLSSLSDVGNSEFENMREPAERLLSKIVRTGDYCSVNIAENSPIAKYLFFGETDNCEPFMEFAGNQIPAATQIFHPFDDDGQHSFGTQLPEGAVERSGLIPACAIALSSNDITPNFLFTFKHKAVQARYVRYDKMIAGAAAACIAICAIAWLWMAGVEKQIKSDHAALIRALSKYTPSVSQQMLTTHIDAARKKAGTIKLYSDNYLPLGVMNEILVLTPADISLVSCNAVFVQADPRSAKSAGNTNTPEQRIELKGIVTTGFTSLEAALTGYILKLDGSPLFKTVTITDKKITRSQDKSSLTFEAVVEII